MVTEYRTLHLWTFVQLPDGCSDTKRVPKCASVYAFADFFRQIIDGRSPQSSSPAAEELPLVVGLRRVEEALTGQAPKDPQCKSFCGVFVGAIGLEIQKRPDGLYEVKAGWRVRRSGTEIDAMDEIFGEAFGRDGDDGLAVVNAARNLAEKVVGRCSLFKNFERTYSANPCVKCTQPKRPNAAGALLFAGLPYSQDSRVPVRLSRAASAADFSTLLVGAGGILAGIYSHNTSNSPWDDRLLQVGVVSLGLNVAIKVVAALYYARYYGE
jgi:hypothetical protein